MGALLASREHIKPNWLEEEFHHSVTALRGGALLAAIALVLVPEGMKSQPSMDGNSNVYLGRCNGDGSGPVLC